MHKINLLDIRVSEVSRCKTTTSIICMCLHDWHLYSCILSLSMHCISLSTKNTSNQSRSRNYHLQSFLLLLLLYFLFCLFYFILLYICLFFKAWHLKLNMLSADATLIYWMLPKKTSLLLINHLRYYVTDYVRSTLKHWILTQGRCN